MSAQTTPVNTNLQLKGYLDANSSTGVAPFPTNSGAINGLACPYTTAPLNQWAQDSAGALHWCNPTTGLWQGLNTTTFASSSPAGTSCLAGVSPNLTWQGVIYTCPGVTGSPSNYAAVAYTAPSQSANTLTGSLSIGPPTQLTQTQANNLLQGNQSSCIVGWGDSLTFGNQDYLGDAWPLFVQQSTNRLTFDYGISGQTSSQIYARFQAKPWLHSCFTVIWAGRNDFYTSIPVVEQNIAAMVAALPSNARYVILGIPIGETEGIGTTNYSLMQTINNYLLATYPSHFINIMPLLISQATSNPVDQLDATEGIPPFTLRAIDATGVLTSPITTTSSCSFTVSNLNYEPGEILTIGSEYIYLNGGSGTTITGCIRGYAGSTASTYTTGTAYTDRNALHYGYTGYQYIASQITAYINANDPVAEIPTSISPYTFDALQNTFSGLYAFQSNTTGLFNTGIGFQALENSTAGNQNTAVGYLAGQLITTGNESTAIGSFALQSCTTCGKNNAIGQAALMNTTTGLANVADGSSAMNSNTTGAYNVAVGVNAMQLGTNNSGLVAIGYQALQNASGSGLNDNAIGFEAEMNTTTGSNDTANGYLALTANTTGNKLTAVGASTLAANTTGNSSTAIGSFALNSTTTGGADTAVGSSAMQYNTTGTDDVAVGVNALLNNTTGGSNTAMGFDALMSNTTSGGSTAVGWNALMTSNGTPNEALGSQALTALTSGNYNVAIGSSALVSATTDQFSVAVGDNALYSQVAASANTGVGYNALYTNVTGTDNAAVGTQALYFATGNYNVALGAYAQYHATTGYTNVSAGYNSLFTQSTGYANTALGNASAYALTTGFSNTVVGAAALSSATTAQYNVALGYNAGVTGTSGNANVTGNGNTYLGAQSGPGSSTQYSYQTDVGFGAVGSYSNEVVLGRIAEIVQIPATTYAALPACASGLQGAVKPITDGNTNTWGATVASGGGSVPALLYCDGTNWTVIGK